jgi:hypothetical protein
MIGVAASHLIAGSAGGFPARRSSPGSMVYPRNPQLFALIPYRNLTLVKSVKSLADIASTQSPPETAGFIR